jgi:hypothetical protein
MKYVQFTYVQYTNAIRTRGNAIRLRAYCSVLHTTGGRPFLLYRQSRLKRFDRTNFVVILYVQHVHYDITIDRADVVVVRTNLFGRQNNMCKKQH